LAKIISTTRLLSICPFLKNVPEHIRDFLAIPKTSAAIVVVVVVGVLDNVKSSAYGSPN
jgi:hypothetical protein